ncbi:hypothetical protein EDD18DRAFT_1353276 [Armillaria luteobubalina]|uniref:CxC2-like cysteine cluster KDZ transposase-associated domain-containing protein n=1 Tax=Armillaria luteobubalina TaxID=153913 RepID=A0AA39Q5A0_9AGAR|nr:hypothetical protein EDD18DRAFT_1353276 [Armillaria luteobubalina]
MKGRAKLYHSDEQAVWNDLSITHSRQIKFSNTGSVFQYAAMPREHRTQHETVTIPNSLIPQEFLYDACFPILEPPQIKKTGPKRYSNSDCPMHKWQGYDNRPGYREEYLFELLCRNGRGDAVLLSKCAKCEVGKDHSSSPLHFLQKWTGERFMKTTLHALDLCIQIGHFDSSECICPE